MSSRRLFIPLGITALCIAAGWLFRPSLPSHSGKTVAEWFEAPDIKDRGLTRSTSGLDAFHGLRGDAVPFLTRVARKSPNWWSRRYAIMYAALPDGIQLMLPPARTDSDYRERQARALWLLGAMASRAREAGGHGPAAPPPLPLDQVLACLRDGLNDPSWMVRAQAAEAAGNFGRDAESLLPELKAMLNESNESIRGAALKAVERIGVAASNTVALPH